MPKHGPTPEEVSEPPSKRAKSDSAPSASQGATLESATSVQIPSLHANTKWTLATIQRMRPPLPDILDPALKKAALTHPGKANNDPVASYERLEWIGDAYLELIASSFIYQTFPTLPAGKSAQRREMLIRNTTLGEFSVYYGLDKMADIPEEFNMEGRVGGTNASQKVRIKILGDLFEAYVGGVILSDPANGIQRASDWLKALWGPLMAEYIREEEKKARKPEQKQSASGQTLDPKTVLEATIGARGVKIEYKDLPSKNLKDRGTKLPLFAIGCFMTGWGETNLQLGHGSALSKKEAGQKAAQMALDNKKLLKKFADKKAEMKAAREAQLQQAGVTFPLKDQPSAQETTGGVL
ncbi:ribonuclease III [Neurospora crassa]|uniref:ribonuclease III n=2 Tax=Neurospora crassa TaxID=5141 RepID=V5IQ18_NEUCR|nr:nucleolar RNAse III [Neurospora crassa OR74A]XP_011393504.1 nucleolar RNAse III, variant [Neurospora crassa OR74A]KHE83580.1 ribonuclease III [Neurospora crassa]ESA43619.1 nucleolar RNAse III [Neurospora crassa OR74A]ESA43620.1 nucleolar RNAse III, variant [Neurospora crassa OR74A]CAB91233.1 related to Ribonuclease III [Neurospora crassa]|eukprot:XP_011393503.1 nucleolar RNAse III [Neurospora crassa OR74A]